MKFSEYDPVKIIKDTDNGAKRGDIGRGISPHGLAGRYDLRPKCAPTRLAAKCIALSKSHPRSLEEFKLTIQGEMEQTVWQDEA